MNVPGLDRVQRIVNTYGESVVTVLAGSQAYGTNNEDSDYDLLGIYRAPTSLCLSMGIFQPTQTLHKANIEGQPDYTYHELGKFVDLACKANPTVLEVLFAEDDCLLQSSPAYNLLVENRNAFLSSAVRRSYGGYAKQQLEKRRRREAQGLEGFGPKTKLRGNKHARHLFRLLLQCRDLLSDGVIKVRLSDDQLSYLKKMEGAGIDVIEREFNAFTLELAGTASVLPPEPDYKRVNELLLELRGL